MNEHCRNYCTTTTIYYRRRSLFSFYIRIQNTHVHVFISVCSELSFFSSPFFLLFPLSAPLRKYKYVDEMCVCECRMASFLLLIQSASFAFIAGGWGFCINRTARFVLAKRDLLRESKAKARIIIITLLVSRGGLLREKQKSFLREIIFQRKLSPSVRKRRSTTINFRSNRGRDTTAKKGGFFLPRE